MRKGMSLSGALFGATSTILLAGTLIAGEAFARTCPPGRQPNRETAEAPVVDCDDDLAFLDLSLAELARIRVRLAAYCAPHGSGQPRVLRTTPRVEEDDLAFLDKSLSEIARIRVRPPAQDTEEKGCRR